MERRDQRTLPSQIMSARGERRHPRIGPGCGYGHRASPHRKPIDSQRNSAMTMSASSTAPRYGHIRPRASSGATSPVAPAVIEAGAERRRKQADVQGGNDHLGPLPGGSRAISFPKSAGGSARFAEAEHHL